ncbi:MAG: hypothetical protein QW272_05835 [Candidatus Methanomethylicaceae archaeon]
MRFYKIKIKNLEPIVLTERRTERGYKNPLRYIQSSTLRGALITSLYLNGYIKKEYLKELMNKPSIVSSNAYPIKDGSESYPAHPFMYECKIEHEDIKGKERKNYINEIIKQLEKGENIEYKIECSKGHMALDYIHPKPIILKNNPNIMFETVSLDTELKISIGVSKHRATTQKGMLYEYDMLIENQEFWAFLGISEELSKYINKDIEIKIGRGISRGYGISKLIDIKEINIDDIKDKINNLIKERMIFYALTCLLDSDTFVNYSSYPEKIDLNDVAKIYGFKLNDCGALFIEKVYGKTRDFSSGWDMVKNVKRPFFKGIASEGSIVIAKLNIKENTKDALAILSLIGYPIKIKDFMIFGNNIMVPIKMHPIGSG